MACNCQEGFSQVPQTIEQSHRREIYNGDNLFTRHGWKIQQEHIKSITGAEMIKEDLDGHTRSLETRLAVHSTSIDGNVTR